MVAKFFDTKCFELAEAFLDDEPHANTKANVRELAAEIQTVIEDFIADKSTLAALRDAQSAIETCNWPEGGIARAEFDRHRKAVSDAIARAEDD